MSTNHSFNIEHAKLYGLREAVLIHNLHFWVDHNYANGKHEHDGRTWTYNSVHAFEALFPYLTYKQIRTSLETLVTLRVLVRGYYSTNPADRSSWFAFTDDFLLENPLSERKAPAKRKAAPSAQEGTPSAPQGKCPSAPQGTPSAPQGKCPSAPQGTPSAQEGKSLIEQIVNTDGNHSSAAPTALPTVIEVLPPAKQKKPKADDTQDTALQAACRATWSAYSDAYCARYGVEPTRNAPVSSKIKQFVIRIGQDESPGVARFFVERVNEAFVVRGYHDVGTLLKSAEAYRTQWVTGQAMTNTRAKQIDQSQANFSAVDEAMAIRRAKQGNRDAQ